jgi:hypothetical protein
MHRRPPSTADNYLDSEEIFRILWNPRVMYGAHRRAPGPGPEPHEYSTYHHTQFI